MAKEELGTKRNCPSCGARFYDLQQNPATCPKCANVFEPESLLKSRRQKSEVKVEKPAEPTPSDELEDDVADDDNDDTLLSLDDDDAEVAAAPETGDDNADDEEDFSVIDPDLADEDLDGESSDDLLDDEDEDL